MFVCFLKPCHMSDENNKLYLMFFGKGTSQKFNRIYNQPAEWAVNYNPASPIGAMGTARAFESPKSACSAVTQHSTSRGGYCTHEGVESRTKGSCDGHDKESHNQNICVLYLLIIANFPCVSLSAYLYTALLSSFSLSKHHCIQTLQKVSFLSFQFFFSFPVRLEPFSFTDFNKP